MATAAGWAQTAAPQPIPLSAWSLAELSRDRPWMPSPYPHITGFYWLTTGTVKDPAAAKQFTDRQPPGRRVVFDWDVYRIAYQHPDDRLTTATGEAEQANARVGFSDRRTLVRAVTPAHQPFVLTGCVANGRSVWRLTPDPDQGPVDLAAVRTGEAPLTFRMGDRTLTMPGGTVHTPAEALSAAGHWIVGPADPLPRTAA